MHQTQSPDPKEQVNKPIARKPSYHSRSHGDIAESMNMVSVHFVFFTKLVRQNLEFSFKYALHIYVFKFVFQN